MQWTEDKIQLAMDNLNKSTSVTEALQAIGCSSSALRKAFKRNGLAPPSTYLKKNAKGFTKPDEPAQPVPCLFMEGDEEPEHNPSAAWKPDFDKRVHFFTYRYTEYSMTFEDMEEVLIMYTSHPPGLGLTAREVAQKYMLLGKPWADADFLGWMFRIIGFSKHLFPTPPHAMFNDEAEIRKAAYNRRDTIIKGAGSEDLLKEQHKRLIEMESRLDELTRAISVAGKSLEESEVKRIDYSNIYGENDPHGGRVLNIPICDLHNGKRVDAQNFAKPQNIFNQEVYWERIKRLCSIINRVSKTADGFFSRVHIAGLGDYFEALLLNMRAGHHVDADSYGGAQYRAVVDGWKAIIDTTLDSFECPVTSILQGGNHDRLTERKEPRSEEVLAFQLSEHLKDYYRDESRFTMDFGAAVVSIMLESGVNLLSIHGHLKKLTNEKDFANFIQIHGFPEAVRYIVQQGHWHSSQWLSAYNTKAVWHSSFCGDDRYNLENLLVGAPPEIMMLDISKNHDLIIGPFNLNYDV